MTIPEHTRRRAGALAALGLTIFLLILPAGATAAPVASPSIPPVRAGDLSPAVLTGPSTYFGVNFLETGLPSGGDWSVTLDGLALFSHTPRIAFNMTNGTYAFAVEPLLGFTASPPSGTLTVNGSSVLENVSFTTHPPTVYAARLEESGLPANTTWSAQVGGVLLTSANTTLYSVLSNGSHPFSLEPVAGYLAAVPHGFLNVSGAPILEFVAFALASGAVPVTFEAHGLPTATPWTIDLNGTSRSSQADSIPVNITPGRYPYSAESSAVGLHATPANGTITVAASPLHVTVNFTSSSSNVTGVYPVSFTPVGLPASRNWSVTLNGTTQSGSGAGSLVFRRPNGTASYQVGVPAGYTATPPAGNFTVVGAPVSISITYVRSPPSANNSRYRVAFSESGLAAGSPWSVSLSGQSVASNVSTIDFTESNGSFPFTLGPVAGYLGTPSAGTVRVNGTTVLTDIAFSPIGARGNVIFVESGLPSGASWSVTLNNTTRTSTASTIAFNVTPFRSYPYLVRGASGYAANATSGTLTSGDTGAPAKVRIAFSVNRAPHGALVGVPAWEYVALVVAILLILAGSAFWLRRRSPVRPAPRTDRHR